MAINATLNALPRIALVTGAAGTMGRVAAQDLIEDGHRVVLADISLDAVSSVAAELGNDSYPIAFNISDHGACSAAMKTIAAEVGEVAVLVNNAGTLSNNKVADTTPDEWHRVMAVSLDGAFYLTRLCLPAMRASKWGR